MPGYCYIFLCCLLTNLQTVAQQPEDYHFINFGIKDGIPEKYIYSAAQDNRGYMWFGTGTGLYRYDGHSFKQFRSMADRPGRTIGNILQAVYKDAGGILWLGSLNALQWYNPEKNIFWSPDYRHPAIKKLADANINGINAGAEGRMWLSTGLNYFYRFNQQDSSFTSLAAAYPANASATTISVYETEGSVYAVHAEGVYIFSVTGKFNRFIPFSAADISNSCFVKEDHTIWLTTLANGLNKFNITGNNIERVLPSNNDLLKNNLFCIARSSASDFFIGGYALHLANTATGSCKTFSSASSINEYNLAANKIASLFFDREHNLWLCSFSGLSMLPWQNNQIKTIALEDHITGAATEPQDVFSIPGTEDLLISNTNASGILYYQAATGHITTIYNSYAEAATDKNINALITAPDSSIFLSDGIRFFKYLTNDKKIILYSLKDQNGNPVINAGKSIFDQQGNIYIASRKNGFYKWHYPSGKVRHYNKWDIDSRETAKSDNELTPCLTDSKQNIWFTSKDGVYRFDHATEKYEHYTNHENESTPLMGAAAYIAEDKLQHYWIATLANGLYELYFEKGKTVLKNYTRNSGIGLPADYCWAIKQNPADSSLWVSNIAGLVKFDPVTKRVLTILNQQNGLAANDGGYSFGFVSNRRLAQLYFGYMNIINLGQYKENRLLPQVFFNSVKVLDREYATQKENIQKKLLLEHNENFFQFEFTALVFNNANKNQYAYQLENIDSGWIFSGQKNTVTYSGLKPGSYSFRVKAANSDGYWGKESVVNIIIQPPFYTSWWFILMMTAISGAVIFGWNRYKINQAKKEERLKSTFRQLIAETEMKALRAQMNPHFIFNSLNSIQKYILKNDHFAASQYLTKFSRLIRLILDHSNQSNIILSSELDMLRLYIEMESLRFDDSFEYDIQIANSINSETITIPSMLIQPYVENAIWHGLLHKEEKGKLTVDFSTDNNGNIQVSIEDNGIGREKAAELKSKQVLKKKSFGMQITEARIAVINRIYNINATSKVIDLKDAAGNAAGTKVMLHIPPQPITTK